MLKLTFVQFVQFAQAHVCLIKGTGRSRSFLAKGKLSCVFFVILSCAVAFFQTLQHSLTVENK